jgi:putative spermidine/putrescine transport system permease protein
MEKWDGKDLPEEPVYQGLYEDLSYLKKNKTYGKIIARLNYEKGWL